jgi:EmrB/QacA subfamily drug resistance transporter
MLRMGTAPARWVLLATVLGSGLAMLDATVVNIALARVKTDLHTGFVALQWVVNGYTLTLAALILLGGALGDRFGRRRVFVIGVAWFAIASALCGLAPSAGALIAGRALQGIGGALLTPGSLALISASFAGRDRAAAVGAWSGLGGIAGAAGPFVGGWLVEWTWRAVFWINLPVAAVVIAVALRHVPESKDADSSGRLDLVGTVVGVLGLAALTYGLTEFGRGGSGGSGRAVAVAATVGGVLLLAVLIPIERRAANPLVPPELVRVRQFVAANAVTLLVYAALGALFVILLLQLQTVAGFSPLLAGASMLPLTVIMILFSARVGALSQRIGPRIPMTAGPVVAAVGVLLMLRIGPGARYLTDVLPAVVVFGAGLSLTVAPLTATVLDAAGNQHTGAASAVNNAVARVAGLLAVALVPAISGLSTAQDPATFDHGFTIAVLIEAGLLVGGALLSGVLIRSPRAAPASDADARLPVEGCVHCGVTGPQLHPRDGSPARFR